MCMCIIQGICICIYLCTFRLYTNLFIYTSVCLQVSECECVCKCSIGTCMYFCKFPHTKSQYLENVYNLLNTCVCVCVYGVCVCYARNSIHLMKRVGYFSYYSRFVFFHSHFFVFTFFSFFLERNFTWRYFQLCCLPVIRLQYIVPEA